MINEWVFNGTPNDFGAAVSTIRENRPDLSIAMPSFKIDGRVSIGFNSNKPFCQGRAVAQRRPSGTIVTTYDLQMKGCPDLDSVWDILVSEIREQGWELEPVVKKQPSNKLSTHLGKLNDMGIPPNLNKEIRQALLDCGPLDTPASLRAVFIDNRISIWQNDLPEANSKTERVDQVISFLYKKQNDAGENGLVLFMKVLRDGEDQKDACYHRLTALASRLEQELKGHSFAESTENLGADVWPKNPSMPLANSKSSNILDAQANVLLLVTATKVEAQAALQVFLQDRPRKRQSIGNNIYEELGFHGGARVFMVQSEMGTATLGGSLSTVTEAIQDLQPEAVIMCGIAFGLQPDKQSLGDILVSKQLQSYEPQKVNEGKILHRGDRATDSKGLLKRFRIADNDWEGAPTHFGLILSGEKLVNDLSYRDSLLLAEPEAIGGEMEGTGVYVAARDSHVDWILVKAICDWADGNKDDKAQRQAARNSAQFVLHMLQSIGWSESLQSMSQPNASVELHLPDNVDFIASNTGYVSKFHLQCVLVNQSPKIEVVKRLQVEVIGPANKKYEFKWNLFYRDSQKGHERESEPVPIAVDANSSTTKSIEFKEASSTPIPASDWTAGRYRFRVTGWGSQRPVLESTFYVEISEHIHEMLVQHHEKPKPISIPIEEENGSRDPGVLGVF